MKSTAALLFLSVFINNTLISPFNTFVKKLGLRSYRRWDSWKKEKEGDREGKGMGILEDWEERQTQRKERMRGEETKEKRGKESMYIIQIHEGDILPRFRDYGIGTNIFINHDTSIEQGGVGSFVILFIQHFNQISNQIVFAWRIIF